MLYGTVEGIELTPAVKKILAETKLQVAAWYKIRIKFISEVLGSGSGSQASRLHLLERSEAELKDKVAHEQTFLPPALSDEMLAGRGKTVFYRENDRPFAWDYQVKGMIKEQVESLRNTDSNMYYAENLPWNYKGCITSMLHVGPEKLFFTMPPGGKIGDCPRSLRAQPYNRPAIVTLTDSETMPVDTTLDVEVTLLDGKLEPVLFECLNMGEYLGFGQWRGAGKGRFNYQILGFKRLDPKDVVIHANDKIERKAKQAAAKAAKAEKEAKEGKKKAA